MGRAQNKNAKGNATGTVGAQRRTRTRTLSPQEQEMKKWESFVRPLWARANAAAVGKDTRDEQNRAKSKAIRSLPTDVQKDLIRAAQAMKAVYEENKDSADPQKQALAAAARQIDNDAREVFIMTNQGFVMQQVRKQMHALDDDDASAIEVLAQSSAIGLSKAMDDYRFTYIDKEGVERPTEAAPLTYAVGKMRHEVKTAKQEGRLINIKSRAYDDAAKVEQAAKAIENRGDHVTLQEVSDVTGVPVERAASMLSALSSKVRLDARVGSDNDEARTVGSLLADDTNLEEGIMDESEREVVRKVVQDLESPYQRRVIEASFGLNDTEKADQAQLYDGVYVDPKTGEQFSAEGAVINEREKRGIAVKKVSQSELNRQFKSGDLVFEAGTAESFELARLKRAERLSDGETLPDISREDLARRVITAETGVPMTSGQIQDTQVKAFYAMSESARMNGLRPRYRGDHELENSIGARQLVRRALVAVGEVSSIDEANRLKASRASKKGTHAPQPLRQVAQKRGWVDDRGRVLISEKDVLALEQARGGASSRTAATSSDDVDFADFMTQV